MNFNQSTVESSTEFHYLQFLAGMCTLDQRLNEYNSSKASPNRVYISDYSLQPLHLKLAWKACLSKTDAAVSNEVFTLLVSLVPYLTKELAFWLFNVKTNRTPV